MNISEICEALKKNVLFYYPEATEACDIKYNPRSIRMTRG